MENFVNMALRERCPYLEFFWSAFSSSRTEYGPENFKYCIQYRKKYCKKYYISWKEVYL